MTSDTENVLSKRATIILRRFQSFRLMRQNLQRARQLKAENIEKKKYMAPVVNKLCPSSTEPHKDCFSMTLDVTPPTSTYAKPIPTPKIAIPTPEIKISTNAFPNCVAVRPFLVLKCNDLSEAAMFYKTAFGAEVIQFPKKRKREEDTITSEVVIKIGGQTFLLNNSGHGDFSRDGGHFTLLTDDVDSAVDKALKATSFIVMLIVLLCPENWWRCIASVAYLANWSKLLIRTVMYGSSSPSYVQLAYNLLCCWCSH